MVPTIRRTKKRTIKGSTAELPPPPILSNDILIRPPLFEDTQSSKLQIGTLLSSDGEYSPDILSELEQSGFGSFLKAVPPKKPVTFHAESLVIKQFRAAKEAYLMAADKHLELNFIKNAAINYSCAVLCALLSEDVFQSAHLMKELGEKIPSSICRSKIFQGVKMLLKANLLKNPEFLVKAEEWLFFDYDYLYKEDQILIRRATSYTEKSIEEG
ncbi:MAG: hypothetical protein KAT16_09005 [Candidatus Heimdallarchaeota archaeon]|nr:hypothetical protein [Candidatus Heimdallarchaeota archaeon]